MKSRSTDPPGFVKDPFKGDSFVMAQTLCTQERRSFLKRGNEIIGFLTITEFALQQCGTIFQQQISQRSLDPQTPFRITASDGRSVIMPAHSALRRCEEGIGVLTRQIFVMLYGSFETFLFQIFERAYLDSGITEDILERSVEILRKKKWDGKLCSMRDMFKVDYKSGDLINHFRGFKMKFAHQLHHDLLQFLDELTEIRHKIVHASSIMQGDQLVSIQAHMFHGAYAFYAHLTDYIDDLFAKKFGYERQLIDPARA